MWLNDSNREKHLVGGMILGMLGTILMAVGCAGGMEFKDEQWGGQWDWKDFWATVIGGVIGQFMQVGMYFLICAIC